jgi:hypothetical protein
VGRRVLFGSAGSGSDEGGGESQCTDENSESAIAADGLVDKVVADPGTAVLCSVCYFSRCQSTRVGRAGKAQRLCATELARGVHCEYVRLTAATGYELRISKIQTGARQRRNFWEHYVSIIITWDFRVTRAHFSRFASNLCSKTFKKSQKI